MKLIVNADDFGLTDGVTYGILDAMNNGIVTSTTMMVNTPGTAKAATIARENPELAVGLHINISLGCPLTDGFSLTENGTFLKPSVIGGDHTGLPLHFTHFQRMMLLRGTAHLLLKRA